MSTHVIPVGDPGAAQGTHQYVMTLRRTDGAHSEAYGTINPKPGATRYDVYRALREQVIDESGHPAAVVVFFSLEPNSLLGGAR